jgi:hypothetical protein
MATDELQQNIDSEIKKQLAVEKKIAEIEQQQWAQEKDAILKETAVLKESLNKTLDTELTDVPASIRGLVMKLPPKEAIEWVTEYKKTHPKKKQPERKPSFYELSHGGKPDPKKIKHHPIDWSL